MKLGSLMDGTKDGSLVVVSQDLGRAVAVPDIASTLQSALEKWSAVEPELQRQADTLEKGTASGVFPFDEVKMASPLPRAYQWADGSAYLSHMKLVRKARGAEMPSSFETDPLLYQGGSDAFLAPHDSIILGDPDWGLDFEAEIAVITDDVPMGTSQAQARSHIKLIMLCNDISLRNILRLELQKGFGFYQSKPASSFSPVCVTPDTLGEYWDGGRVSLPLISTFNDCEFGHPNAGCDLYFDFPALIAHASRTRSLGAGTIIGSGTVSNEDHGVVGSSCLAEQRMIETIAKGIPKTNFMMPGDRIRIEMLDAQGASIFGAIDQTVVAA